MSSSTASPLDQVEVPVEIRLGSVDLSLEEVLRVGPGFMVPLGAVSDEPVELAVSGIPYAVGDLVVVDGCFAFRVREVRGDPDGRHTATPGGIVATEASAADDTTSPDEITPPSGPDADPAPGDA